MALFPFYSPKAVSGPPRLRTWKSIPSPENVASVVTFAVFYQDIPALSIWWLSPFHLTIWWLSPFHLTVTFPPHNRGRSGWRYGGVGRTRRESVPSGGNPRG